MKTRLFILAIDGLEYRLVEEWKLSEIKQEVWCKVNVSEFETILTPIIWASFITGTRPEEHGIHSWWMVSKNEIVDKVIHKIRYKLPGLENATPKILRKMGKAFGLADRTPQIADLKRRGFSTIFDYASNPIALFVPSYNEPTEIRKQYSKALEKGVSTYEKTLWRIHKKRVANILKYLNSNWDLFMAWLDIADQICHIHDYNTTFGRIKIMRTYFGLNTLVREIKNSLEDQVLFMIVSDHGVDLRPGGHHSHWGFFSLNIDICWKPESILDYAPFIKKTLDKSKARTNYTELVPLVGAEKT